jgi:hypothetical protein
VLHVLLRENYFGKYGYVNKVQWLGGLQWDGGGEAAW